MKRILIVGCCGAGKTTLSYVLSNLTKLPVIHLDKEYYLPEWVTPNEDTWVEKVNMLISKPEWIIEGNYASSLDARLSRADTIIFLDYPRFTCVSRVLLRTLKTFRKTRPDMAQGCKERFNWDFFKYVWNFHKTMHPRIITSITNHPEVTLVHLRNDKDAEKYIDSLGL